MKALREYIDKYLARGFIQLAKSRVAAPVLFKKKDGTMRLCFDFRGINGVCVENMYSVVRFSQFAPVQPNY